MLSSAEGVIENNSAVSAGSILVANAADQRLPGTLTERLISM
jgi:hypothetical protein